MADSNKAADNAAKKAINPTFSAEIMSCELKQPDKGDEFYLSRVAVTRQRKRKIAGQEVLVNDRHVAYLSTPVELTEGAELSESEYNAFDQETREVIGDDGAKRTFIWLR